MALNGANRAPNPDLDFQLVGLQTGGTYTFAANAEGTLDFVGGTTFPYGLDVSTMAELKCPTKIIPGGGNIQLGESNGDDIFPGAGSGTSGGDIIWVYGTPYTSETTSADAPENAGFTLADYNDLCSSDIRLKTDIEPIKNSLEKINKLSGNAFKWLFDPKPGTLSKKGKSDYGVLAQEVQQVLPDAVSKRHGYLSVNYEKIIPLLIEGIKDLSQHVKLLESEIKELKG